MSVSFLIDDLRLRCRAGAQDSLETYHERFASSSGDRQSFHMQVDVQVDVYGCAWDFGCLVSFGEPSSETAILIVDYRQVESPLLG